MPSRTGPALSKGVHMLQSADTPVVIEFLAPVFPASTTCSAAAGCVELTATRNLV